MMCGHCMLPSRVVNYGTSRYYVRHSVRLAYGIYGYGQLQSIIVEVQLQHLVNFKGLKLQLVFISCVPPTARPRCTSVSADSNKISMWHAYNVTVAAAGVEQWWGRSSV